MLRIPTVNSMYHSSGAISEEKEIERVKKGKCPRGNNEQKLSLLWRMDSYVHKTRGTTQNLLEPDRELSRAEDIQKSVHWQRFPAGYLCDFSQARVIWEEEP